MTGAPAQFQRNTNKYTYRVWTFIRLPTALIVDKLHMHVRLGWEFDISYLVSTLVDQCQLLRTTPGPGCADLATAFTLEFTRVLMHVHRTTDCFDSSTAWREGGDVAHIVGPRIWYLLCMHDIV